MPKTNMNKTTDSAVEIIDLEGAYPEVTTGLANACSEPTEEEIKSWYEDIDRKIKIAHALVLMRSTKRRVNSKVLMEYDEEARKAKRTLEIIEGSFVEYEDNLLRAKNALEIVMAARGIDFKIL